MQMNDIYRAYVENNNTVFYLVETFTRTKVVITLKTQYPIVSQEWEFKSVGSENITLPECTFNHFVSIKECVSWLTFFTRYPTDVVITSVKR